MDKSKQAKSVYLTKENINYIQIKAIKAGEDFSTTLNNILNERRYNEQFNSCQNQF